MKIILYTLLSFITIATTGQESNPEFIDQPALLGTLQIKWKNATASSFQYMAPDSTGYLVTAKHLFKTKRKRTIMEKGKSPVVEVYDTLTVPDGAVVDLFIFYDGRWTPVNSTLHYNNDSSDVAVLKTDIPMSGNNYKFGMGNIIVSQPCFFLGFPLGARQDLSKLKEFGKYPIPFVRKGIVSGMGTRANATPTIFIDGHNTYGFSGGPLIFYNYYLKSFYVAGVISGYLPQKNNWYDKKGNLQISEENSGTMVVYNIDFAKDILRRLRAM